MSRQLYWWCLFCLSTFIASLPFFRLSRLFFSSMLLLLFESQIGAKKVRGDTMGWNNIWRNFRILCVPFPAEESLFVNFKKKTAKKNLIYGQLWAQVWLSIFWNSPVLKSTSFKYNSRIKYFKNIFVKNSCHILLEKDFHPIID